LQAKAGRLHAVTFAIEACGGRNPTGYCETNLVASQVKVRTAKDQMAAVSNQAELAGKTFVLAWSPSLSQSDDSSY
jgi:hypothetical protein